MEKNIAALLRQDAKTVAVQFKKARVTDEARGAVQHLLGSN